MARREFPNDSAADMDDAAVAILVANMRKGAASEQRTATANTIGWQATDLLVNNTGSDIRLWESEIRAAAEQGQLPEDLADMFTLRFATHPATGQLAAIIDVL